MLATKQTGNTLIEYSVFHILSQLNPKYKIKGLKIIQLYITIKAARDSAQLTGFYFMGCLEFVRESKETLVNLDLKLKIQVSKFPQKRFKALKVLAASMEPMLYLLDSLLVNIIVFNNSQKVDTTHIDRH